MQPKEKNYLKGRLHNYRVIRRIYYILLNFGNAKMFDTKILSNVTPNRLAFYSLVISTLLISNNALSNTSGVHGPNVKADERSLQWRIALSPSDSSDQEDNWASRLHYQHAFNSQLRGRIILQVRDRGSFDYEYIRGELLYNFKKATENDNWSSGVRLDVRQRRGSRPEEYALNWTNQWDLDDGYRLRAIMIAARQFGSDSAFNGTELETRSSISKKLDNGLRVGIEMFNEYGEIGEFGSFNSQTHQVGPMIGGKIDDIKWEFRWLMGVTARGRDNNLGLRFTMPM